MSEAINLVTVLRMLEENQEQKSSLGQPERERGRAREREFSLRMAIEVHISSIKMETVV